MMEQIIRRSDATQNGRVPPCRTKKMPRKSGAFFSGRYFPAMTFKPKLSNHGRDQGDTVTEYGWEPVATALPTAVRAPVLLLIA